MSFISGALAALAFVAGWASRAHLFPRAVYAYRVLREHDFVRTLNDRGVVRLVDLPQDEPEEGGEGGSIIH